MVYPKISVKFKILQFVANYFWTCSLSCSISNLTNKFLPMFVQLKVKYISILFQYFFFLLKMKFFFLCRFFQKLYDFHQKRIFLWQSATICEHSNCLSRFLGTCKTLKFPSGTFIKQCFLKKKSLNCSSFFEMKLLQLLSIAK